MKTVVFDSGCGGLPILNALRCACPNGDFCYLSDTAGLPYGSRALEDIEYRVKTAIECAEPFDLVVIACNTATVAAGKLLRSALDVPVYGIEPAVKPALAKSSGAITVLCTPFTAKLRGYCDPRVQVIADPLLAEKIERGLRADDADCLQRLAEAVSERAAPDVVLGCTHYSYLGSRLTALGHNVYDGGKGLVANVCRVLVNEGGGTLSFNEKETEELYLRLTKEHKSGILNLI